MMPRMIKLPDFAVFGAALGLGTVLLIAATDLLAQQAPLTAQSMQMTARIAVAGQLSPGQVAALKARGFDSVVAMHPGGKKVLCAAW